MSSILTRGLVSSIIHRTIAMYSHVQVILIVYVDRTRIRHGLLATAALQFPVPLTWKLTQLFSARSRASNIGKYARRRRLREVWQPWPGGNVNVGFGYEGCLAVAWGAGGVGGYLGHFNVGRRDE